MTRKRCVWIGSAMLLMPLAVQAGDVPVLRGQLQGSSRIWFENLFVTMEEVTGHAVLHRVDAGPDGAFQFRAVPYGEYRLRVIGLGGETICEQYVTVAEHMNNIVVQLPAVRQQASAPGTVSVRQLRSPPDKKAVRAFETAVTLSSQGRYQDAAIELQKAIRISPEFAEAYTNLAAHHMRMGRYEEALEETHRAMEIAGPSALNLCNRGYAFFQLGRIAEAAESARAALRIDSGYLQGHLILGAVLANDPGSRDEAIRHLELAAKQFPSARVNLERLRALR